MPVQNTETRLVDIAERMPRRPDYYLTVAGNSMSAVGIRDGDLVAVKHSDGEPTDGAIVVARAQGGVTVKRFWRVDAETVELRPESDEAEDTMQAINTADEGWEIDGEVVGIITMKAPQAPKTARNTG